MANSGLCSVDNCGKPARVRELCNGHYWRLRQYGHPFGGGTANGDPLKFYTDALLFAGDGCLVWPFWRDLGGYARMMHEGQVRTVSRVICEAVHGAPPSPEHEAAHSCGRGHEGCVSPKHIEWKTPLENDKDKDVHGTRCNGEDHPSAKLTAADVVNIRRLLAVESAAAIARKYGVSRTAIRKVKHGATWAHVP